MEAKGGQQPVVHLRAHFDSELWGLALHPTKAEMITVGRDSMMAVWDMPTRKQKLNVKLEAGADAVAISPNGQHIAIGFINGKFSAFEYPSLNLIKQNNHRKGKAIQVMRYSPDNAICAVGAHDSMIFLYNVNNNYSPMKKIKSHHSTITHIDFTLDSSALMSNCTSYEILFHDASTGK